MSRFSPHNIFPPFARRSLSDEPPGDHEIRYRVYSNDLAGGPVDYSSPIHDGPLLHFVTDPIPFNSDATFAVRAYDLGTGYEERNVSATWRVVTGPAGEDLLSAPPPVFGLSAYGSGSAALSVSWYSPVTRGPKSPTGFNVYAEVGPLSYTSPVASLDAVQGFSAYSVALGGLTPGEAYTVAVRPYNASAEQSSPARTIVVVAPPPAPPAPEGGSVSPSTLS